MKIISSTFIMLVFLQSVLFSAMPVDSLFVNFRGIPFIRIPADSFQMGFEGRELGTHIPLTPYVKYGIHNEHPNHVVHLDSFYIGKNEITIGQYKLFNPAITSRYGAYDPKSDSIPVYAISWNEADSFCKWLTAGDPSGYVYRLPTEAEWEYACRAKTSTWYHTGDTLATTMANLNLNSTSGGGLKKIGLYPANPFGLHDMHGNVREWCFDWFGPYQPEAVTNPGGAITGHLKTVRSITDNTIFARTVARGSLPPSVNNKLTGFRVVISRISTGDFSYTPASPDEPYQKNVAPTRPAPLNAVSGETYTDSDGRVFRRTRMTNVHFPAQEDSVVYVSSLPISGDSAATRKLAGLYARSLSDKEGVLYRISNKYELLNAGVTPGNGELFLTILPDIRYPAWQDATHPDVAYFKWRVLPRVDTTFGIGGPLYLNCNHAPQLAEAPNGDILIGFFSGITEDHGERVMAISRLKLGDAEWDSVTSSHDIAGWRELGGFMNNTFGELIQISITAFGGFQSNPNTFLRKSADNGITYGSWKSQYIYNFPFNINRLTPDTLVSMGMYHKRLHISADSGLTWSETGTASIPGINKSMVIADDGKIRVFVRPDMGAGAIKNSDSVATMAQYVTTNRGNSYTAMPTPFIPQGIGVYDLALKLISGRMIMVTRSPDGKCVIAESIDNGETWFCRRKLNMTMNVDFMGNHKGLAQGRDGIVHVVGAPGSCGFQPGNIPHIAFSEQWLREGSCLDISQWGINTAGMVSECPSDDNPATSGEKTSSSSSINEPFSLAALPNPFNPSTTILCNLPKNIIGEYAIYSANGRMIKKFRNLSGTITILWDGTSDNGDKVASGIYIGKIKTKGGIVLEHKLFLQK